LGFRRVKNQKLRWTVKQLCKWQALKKAVILVSRPFFSSLPSNVMTSAFPGNFMIYHICHSRRRRDMINGNNIRPQTLLYRCGTGTHVLRRTETDESFADDPA
jgi:hypothetical protein